MNRKYIKRRILKLTLLVVLISNQGYKLCPGFQRAMNIELSPGKHIIRASLFHSVRDSGDKVQVRDQNGFYSISNPVEVEVLPDEWERRYSPKGDLSLQSSQDLDSDGYTNVEEYLNQTNPNKK